MKPLYLHSLYSSTDREVSYNGYKGNETVELRVHMHTLLSTNGEVLCAMSGLHLYPPLYPEHLVVLYKLQNSYQFAIKATDSNFIILYRYAATCFNQLRGHPQVIYINKPR
jgi:hypothetical protein